MKKSFALIIVQDEIQVFEQEQSVWHVYPVFREGRNSLKNKTAAEIVEKINEYLNSSDNLKEVDFFIVADRPGYACGLPETFGKLGNESWQLVLWQSAKERAVLVKPLKKGETAHLDTQWLATVLIPTVEGSLRYQDEALLKERERDLARHHEEQEKIKEAMEKLGGERHVLEAEINRLKAQLALLDRPSMEQLATYLPVLYRNFWNSVKPSDLALLAGRYNLPEVPSPFPEPDNHTVSQMKKRLQAMPVQEQERLREFCAELPSNLNIRPEMRFFFE